MAVPGGARVNVSVVIPAHNAAGTIAETLGSLCAQTFQGWEAIVIDDGSSDSTAAIAACFVERDARFRLVRQPQMGTSAARNTGIRLAHFDWLLFLDADDLLLPLHLEWLTRELASDPSLDAVHCGWARMAPDGTRLDEARRLQSDDLFAGFARGCAFAIHACLVRRSLVEAVGGFDTSLRTCEDWDLWQRVARTGARFGAVREVLAFYRMQPASASIAGLQMLTDGLRVITRGHAPDARVSNPNPAHADGLSTAQLPSAKLYFACWAAGLVLGHGEDARPLLGALKDEYDPGLDPNSVAESIFKAALLPTCQSPAAWDKLWLGLEQRLNEFLLALEAQSLAAGLAHRARTILERMIVEHSTAPRPLTIGATHAVRVEVTEPILDILAPASVERLQCAVELERVRIGTLELPVCEGLVPGHVLADAIAAKFSWVILGRFFERTIYRDLSVEQEPTGFSLWRGALRLANGLAEDEYVFWSQAHDRVGWTVFLQEIWGRPDWPDARFYDPQAAGEMAARRRVSNGWLVVEVSEDLPDVKVSGSELHVVLQVGGVTLGVVTVPARQSIVRAQELRAALTSASGFELGRAAIREGLLGRRMAGPASLRARLATAAAAAVQRGGGHLALEAAANIVLAPGSDRALGRALSPGERGLVLGRRAYEVSGTSISRRAMLPAAAAPELVEAASVAGEPVVWVPPLSERPERVAYAPDLVSIAANADLAHGRVRGSSGPIGAADRAVVDPDSFTTFFMKQPDLWKYTSPYEQTKYEQTLALLPSSPIGRALELACAEGHFTKQLAPRVGTLIAADISQTALNRAAERCTGLGNVHLARLDLTRDPLPGRFELIVCSEALYFVGGRDTLRTVARKLAQALEPGGYLVTAHANLVVDEPDRTGFDWNLPFGAKVIGETLTSIGPLRLIKELWTPLYRIQLFQRDRLAFLPLPRTTPEVIEFAVQPTPLLPQVAAQVLWRGSHLWHSDATQTVVTDRLPILMYHRVAPTGSPATARYRVTPEAFEEQLRYLRDAGYYSIKLEDWHAAMEAKRPLPGRAVLITFDDGYLDFLTYAWPLLRRYGFSATVFLVADKIGCSSSWDRVSGEEVPLLGWKEVCQLRDEGVKFGSHSASHRPLTALSLAEVVREGVRSRAILERGLGVPIRAFAYPHGDVDQAIQHLIGACGYSYGLSCRPDLSRFQDSLLTLPRIEVAGSDGLPQFVAKLSPWSASDE